MLIQDKSKTKWKERTTKEKLDMVFVIVVNYILLTKK